MLNNKYRNQEIDVFGRGAHNAGVNLHQWIPLCSLNILSGRSVCQIIRSEKTIPVHYLRVCLVLNNGRTSKLSAMFIQRLTSTKLHSLHKRDCMNMVIMMFVAKVHASRLKKSTCWQLPIAQKTTLSVHLPNAMNCDSQKHGCHKFCLESGPTILNPFLQSFCYFVSTTPS